MRNSSNEHVDISKINQVAPVFVVDDNYLRRIDELPPDKEQREVLIEKRLRAILVHRQGNLPRYKTLLERLEEIIRHKEDETQETLALLIHLAGEVNEAMKEEAASGASRGELAIRQLVRDTVPYGEPDELVQRIKSVVSESTFPGWQHQPTVEASIRKEIIIKIAQYVKEHPECVLNPDDYFTISKEALKYIERYY